MQELLTWEMSDGNHLTERLSIWKYSIDTPLDLCSCLCVAGVERQHIIKATVWCSWALSVITLSMTMLHTKYHWRALQHIAWLQSKRAVGDDMSTDQSLCHRSQSSKLQLLHIISQRILDQLILFEGCRLHNASWNGNRTTGSSWVVHYV